jgi:hypothetical protein
VKFSCNYKQKTNFSGLFLLEEIVFYEYTGILDLSDQKELQRLEFNKFGFHTSIKFHENVKLAKYDCIDFIVFL